MARMTENDLRAAVDQQVRNALGYQSSKLSEQRRKALAYYLAKPVGDLSPPEIEGRSRVVATDVADTVNAMLPPILKTFVAGDNVVEFTPQHPEDEDKAKQATEYVNHVFYRQNPGFQIMHTWFNDALIQKNGILKVWWQKEEKETREDYSGLTDDQMTLLLTDPANETKEVIEHASYPDPAAQQQQQQALQQLQQMQGDPAQIEAQAQQIMSQPLPMLHDVALKVVEKTGKVCIENVPPEEFLISRQAKSIHDTPFLAHRVLRTISDLYATGYKKSKLEQLTSDESGVYSAERIERISIDDDMAWQFGSQESPSDKSMRRVWLTECYVQVDYNGDGIAEWRKVTLAGDTLLDNEEVDGHPFVSITPIPLSHRFFGTCPAEQAMETQRIRTALWRASLDNLYLGVNGRYFAVENQVNLDDLLTVRPGGVVRIKNPGAVGRLDQGMGDNNSAMQMMEFLEHVREDRTGFTRYSQGNNADSLNKTATGINIITNKADQRIELICRVFAETGVSDLFKRILELVTKYQDKPATVRLTNGWATIDPREWKNGFDLSINVGLGTGNKDQIVSHLMNLMMVQKEGMQIGLATPQNLFNSAKQLASNLGFKEPEQFFQDPAKQPPQPPKPDPEMVKAQAEAQLQQQKLQNETQIQQMHAQREEAQAMREFQLQQQRLANEMQLEREKLEADIALKREDMIYKYQAQRESEQYAALYQQSERMVDDGNGVQ